MLNEIIMQIADLTAKLFPWNPNSCVARCWGCS